MTISKSELLHAVAIASAGYFAGNSVAEDRIEAITKTFFRVLSEGSGSSLLAVDHPPFVPIAESLKDDEITCLDCGQSFRSLKRHLVIQHGLTPESYRAKWGLSDTYPMVPRRTSEIRSNISRTTIQNLRETGRRVGRAPQGGEG